MSILKALSELLKLVNDNKSLINSSTKLSKVNSLSRQIDKLMVQYAEVRGLPGSISGDMEKQIELKLQKVEEQLRKFAGPKLPRPKFSRPKPTGKDLARDFTGLAIKASTSYLAQSELSRIYLARIAGRLPPNPRTWDETRKYLQRQRSIAARLNRQLKIAAANNKKKIAKMSVVADAFRSVEKDPYFDAEQQAMLDIQWEELEDARDDLVDGRKKLQSYIALTNQIIRHCDSLVLVGDIANKLIVPKKTEAELMEKILEDLK